MGARRPTCSMARNSDVSPYIGKLSRSKLYSKKGLYKREHKAAAPSDKAEAKEETAYYPADDVAQVAQADQAARVDHARHGPDPPRRPLPRQACRLPWPASLRPSPGHRSLQGERCPASPR